MAENPTGSGDEFVLEPGAEFPDKLGVKRPLGYAAAED